MKPKFNTETWKESMKYGSAESIDVLFLTVWRLISCLWLSGKGIGFTATGGALMFSFMWAIIGVSTGSTGQTVSPNAPGVVRLTNAAARTATPVITTAATTSASGITTLATEASNFGAGYANASHTANNNWRSQPAYRQPVAVNYRR